MQDTEALLRAYYDAFNRKDWSGMLALLHDEVAHDANQGGREVGKEAFKRFLASMDTHYDETLRDMTVMVAQGGRRAAAEFICDGVYKVSADGLPPARGQRYSLPVGAFFDVEAGKIKRVTNYYNLQDWIRQVSR